MQKLFAVDSMAVLYRGYFAMIRTPLVNSKGLNTSGIRTFLMQLINIIEEEKPDYLAVTSDSVEPTFRHEKFPEYKATREKMPEDLVDQLPYLPRLVESLNLPFLKLPGYEADDIVGTLMRICREKQLKGVIVSSDKDFMQLITEEIVMLNHRNEIIGISQVYEKFGCLPEQVIEILGLMGDTSDNIPGVRGVGEKTAKKLIKEFGSIEQVYSNIEKIDGKSLKEKLQFGFHNALLSKELATINCNAPLKIDLEKIRMEESCLYDNPNFFSLLEELEFNTLINRLKKKIDKNSFGISKISGGIEKKHLTNDEFISSQIEAENQLNFLEIRSKEIKNVEELKAYLNTIVDGQFIAVYINIDGVHQLDLTLKGIALCSGFDFSVYIDMERPEEMKNIMLAEMKNFFESQTNPKIFFDIKKNIQLFKKLNIFVKEVKSDVMLGVHMVDPLSKRYDLDYLMARNLNLKRKKTESAGTSSKESQLSMFKEIDNNNQYIKYCENASIIFRLNQKIEAQIKRTGMESAYRNIEIPLAKSLAELEISGICLNLEIMSKIALEFDSRLRELRYKIFDLSGEEFNPNSIVELQNIIYEKFRLHEIYNVKPKKIKLGNKMSTDEETLEKFADNDLPRTILYFRTLNKLKNTYIDQLPGYVHLSTGCIHSTFRQIGTATGRLSSENPNLQNIPVRSREGRRIRKAFIPSRKDKILVSADYSQIELRVVAHYSKDPTFMDAYRKKLDIHALTASAIYNVPVNEVTRDMRSKAKEVNFGLIYRMGAEKLSIVTKTSKNNAKEFIERFFQKYSTIHSLQERFLQKARKEGYAETLFGRRRYLVDINNKGLLKRLAEGAAINTPIQGSAAEIIKLSMIAVDRVLREKKMDSKMILTVHDELVFDAIKDEVEELCEIVKYTMENVVVLEVPLLVEIGQGETWLDAH